MMSHTHAYQHAYHKDTRGFSITSGRFLTNYARRRRVVSVQSSPFSECLAKLGHSIDFDRASLQSCVWSFWRLRDHCGVDSA